MKSHMILGGVLVRISRRETEELVGMVGMVGITDTKQQGGRHAALAIFWFILA